MPPSNMRIAEQETLTANEQKWYLYKRCEAEGHFYLKKERIKERQVSKQMQIKINWRSSFT
jgi:transcription elongation factor